MITPTDNSKRWPSLVLRLAALYNLAWGLWVILVPFAAFDLFGAARPNYPQLWQCVGMIVGVYGVGYWLAARDPSRHWPIVLVGLLGKIFGPIGFAKALADGVFPARFGLMIVTNDLIWWIPFAMILRDALVAHARGEPVRDARVRVPGEAMAEFRVSGGPLPGVTLDELSQGRTLLVVFLRHIGCTFCREALADLRSARARIERAGVKVALVHMGDDTSAAAFFAGYGLGDVARVSDPQRVLYRAFDLGRGSWSQLFGLKVWLRGFRAGLIDGHGVGELVGDGFQMPGAFVVRDGAIVLAYRHATAADRPDYEALACTLP